jgi:chromate transporter
VIDTLLSLAGVLMKLSVLAFGSSATVLGEMQREFVLHGWISPDQFSEIFAISQITPGPGSLLIVPLGYQAAGVAGAAVALGAFFAPTAVLAALALNGWSRIRESRWAQAARLAVTPVATGLILAATAALGRESVHDYPSLAIGVLAFALMWRTKLSPALIVVGAVGVGAAVGLVG